MINTGFNATVIRSQMGALRLSYQAICKLLTADLEATLIVPVSNEWACQEAVDFWKAFSNTVTRLVDESIYENYKNMFATLNSSVSAWAQTTGNRGAWSNETLTKSGSKLNTGLIQENLLGVRGINGEKVKSICDNTFNSVISSCKVSVNGAKAAVTALGFIDRDKTQVNAICKGLDNMLEAIITVIKQVQASLNEEVAKCDTKYGTLVTEVSGAYGA